MQNQFDSIDLSDNNVIILEGFPKLPRLKTLILNNNRITRISKHLEGKQPSHHPASTFFCIPSCEATFMPDDCELLHAESIPNLTQLVLTNNKLKNLGVRHS